MKPKTVIILILFFLLAVLWGAAQSRGRSQAEARADSAKAKAEEAHKVVDSLLLVEAALRERYKADTTYLTRWRTRWDSIMVPGKTDTFTVERVIYIADSTIKACEAVIGTCELRVAAATERGDSASSEAAHYKEAARQWEKIAKGAWLRFSVEGTTDLDWKPEAAADLTLGRSRLKALGRVVVREGAESCTFSDTANAYGCSSEVQVEGRFGLRYTF